MQGLKSVGCGIQGLGWGVGSRVQGLELRI